MTKNASDSTQFAKAIRLHALHMTHAANSSHIGSCLSMADMLAVLYAGGVLKHRSGTPDWPDRDRLIISKGHASAVVYGALAEAGYFDKSLLATFSMNGSLLQGHVSHHVPGVEFSTGSLGHGLSVACGLAVGGLRDNASYRVYAILSDGELDEGSNWEAIMFAGHHKLGNLTVIVDYNKIQSFGHTKAVLDLEPLAEKWRTFGWDAVELDGHDHAALKKALSAPSRDKPQVLIAHTIKGKGVSFMEGTLEWHYKSPSPEQLQKAIAEVEAGA